MKYTVLGIVIAFVLIVAAITAIAGICMVLYFLYWLNFGPGRVLQHYPAGRVMFDTYFVGGWILVIIGLVIGIPTGLISNVFVKHAEAKASELISEVDVLLSKCRKMGEMDRHEEAIKCFDALLEINPNRTRAPQLVKAYFYKGVALHKLKRYQEARDCWQRFIENAPANEVERVKLAKEWMRARAPVEERERKN